MKRVDKQGQMKLSFGMIFSIILIIAFIAFAVYGISYFLDLKDSAQVGTFTDDFQSDLEEKWRASEVGTSHSYNLPSEYTEICIHDLDESDGDYNLGLSTEDSQFQDEETYTIECGQGTDCMNVENSPDCTEIESGEFSLSFQKSSGDAQVTVSTE